MTAAMESGCHLLFDATSKRILNKTDLEAFLTECPRLIGLTIFSGPHIYATESGWAGIVLVAESHISVHTSVLEVFGDCFSCLPFDSKAVMDMARRMLAFESRPKPVSREIKRGWGSRC